MSSNSPSPVKPWTIADVAAQRNAPVVDAQRSGPPKSSIRRSRSPGAYERFPGSTTTIAVSAIR